MRLGKAWTLAVLLCALPGVAYAQEEPTGNDDARACTDPSEATTAALPSGLAFTSAEITRTYHPATAVHAPAIVITHHVRYHGVGGS